MTDLDKPTIESGNHIPTAPAVEPSPPQAPYWVVVLALLAGIVGGMYGALDLSQRPFFQNLFGQGPQDSSLSQTVQVTEDSAVTNVVSEAGPAVVSIVISRDVSQDFIFDPFGFFGSQPQAQSEPNVQEVGAGSGFFVSPDGWIMTNKHVVLDETATYTVVTKDGESYEAKVMARDPSNDLALMKIEISNAPYLRFADSDNLQLGQSVVAIGNSLGQYQNTVTFGIISGVGRSIRAGGGGISELLEGVIQTDAAINQGNSGGPLLNLAGSVVGINTAVDFSGQSIGFAIPANDAKIAFESYQRNGKILRPYLGVRYTMITPAIAEANDLPKDYGALIVRGSGLTDFGVLPGSPGDRAGLRENDIILELGGQRLDEDNSLARALRKFSPGERVEAKIYRDGGEQNITIEIGERTQ